MATNDKQQRLELEDTKEEEMVPIKQSQSDDSEPAATNPPESPQVASLSTAAASANASPVLSRASTQSQSLRQTSKIPCWLSFNIRVDDFNIKTQSFSITGWINIFWEWDAARCPEYLQNFKQNESEYTKQFGDNVAVSPLNRKLVRVSDLRLSELRYAIPLNPLKIFSQTSVDKVSFIDPPHLCYNTKTKVAHSKFYIRAVLLEQLELFMFPFDFQFANMKLKVNYHNFQVLPWDQSSREINRIIKTIAPNSAARFEDYFLSESERENCLQSPCKVSLKDDLLDDFLMLDCWIDFAYHLRQTEGEMEDEDFGKTSRTPAMLSQAISAENSAFQPGIKKNFALIRLRINRSAKYYVTNILLPLFVIMTCSFSIFFIDSENIGERLGVSVTILLIFTTFQEQIGVELPQSSIFLMIDIYIIAAYIIQLLLVLIACIASTTEYEIVIFGDTSLMFDEFCCAILFAFWVLLSGFYFSFGNRCLLKLYQRCSYRCADWQKRAEIEIKTWDKWETYQVKKYEKAQFVHEGGKQPLLVVADRSEDQRKCCY